MNEMTSIYGYSRKNNSKQGQTHIAWNRLRPDSNAFSHIKRLQH